MTGCLICPTSKTVLAMNGNTCFGGRAADGTREFRAAVLVLLPYNKGDGSNNSTCWEKDVFLFIGNLLPLPRDHSTRQHYTRQRQPAAAASKTEGVG